MANVLSDKDRIRAENKRLWAIRNKEAQSLANTPVTREARIKEFRDKLLDGPTGSKILEKVLQIAMDDNHQGQMAAMKMCVERILPMSYFDNSKEAPRSAIQINITGLGGNGACNSVDVHGQLPQLDQQEVEELRYYEKPEIVAVPGYVEVTDEVELRKLVDGDEE